MAPKQLRRGLNIGDTDALLQALGRPKTFSEIMKQYDLGLQGKGPLKDKFLPPIGQIQPSAGEGKITSLFRNLGNVGLGALDQIRGGAGIISAFTDPTGNIIGDYLNQESEAGFQQRLKERDRTKDPTGSELFLPEGQEQARLKGNVGAKSMADVPGMDIFTQAGQDALGASAAKAIQETLGKNVGDPSAFGAGDFADTETVKKVQEEVDKQNIDTSAPDSDIDYTGDVAEKDLETATATGVEGADTAAKQATVKALDEFLKDARPGVSPKTFDEYINEFGEATGLDISGEADTKQALMSFGAALMQNRAGKGFNISRILTSVGEATEAAMPDFRKATAEAKAIRAKAGAYALSKRDEDKKLAMDKKQYFVIPRGDGTAGSITNMIAGGKGRLTRLNSYELNSLTNNPEFEKQFEIVDADFYKDYAKAAINAAGKKKFYQSKAVDVPLFAEAPKGLSFKAQLIDGNVAPAGTSPLFVDSSKRVVGLIQSMERKVDYNAKQFEQLAKLLNTTDVTVLDQGRSIIKQTLRNFGLNIGDTDPVKQIKTIMQRLQATNAAEILQESGKTLSDADRKFVREIVGDVNFLEGDEAVLRAKLSNLFNVIVKRGRENIKDAYDTLGAYGVNIDRTNIVAQGSKMTQGEDGVFRFRVEGTT